LSALRFPLRDAFGTRADLDALILALSEIGLPAFGLCLRDEGIVLLLAGHACSEMAVGKALTILRTTLSPLTPCEVKYVPESVEIPRVRDERSSEPTPIYLGELTAPTDADFREDLIRVIRDLARRARLPIPCSLTVHAEPDWQQQAKQMVEAISSLATDDTLETEERPWHLYLPGHRPEDGAKGIHILARLQFPLGKRDTHPPTGVLLVLALDARTAIWFDEAIDGSALSPEARFGVLMRAGVILDGLEWEIGRRPIVAATSCHESALVVIKGRATSDESHDMLTPRAWTMGASGIVPRDLSQTPAALYDTIEACVTDALRPRYSVRSATHSRTLSHRPGWLSRLIGHPGPSTPAPFPPACLSSPDRDTPRYVLGLAVMTMQEHAAVLLKDGSIVGAIEEERLTRVRHYGYRPKGRPPFITPAVDPTIPIEEVFCHKAIAKLLDDEGISLDDVDLIAVNGLHGRYRNLFSRLEEGPMPMVKTGRVVYVPHHLCHAASAYRVSGMDDAWILTVDGRGDRETAACFRGVGREIRPIYTLLSLHDTSIGGMYESATRHLGFGNHGQGSFMALASFGEPTYDVGYFLSVRSLEDTSIHEAGFAEAFADCRRDPGGKLEKRHSDLAASVQQALEETMERLVVLSGMPPDSPGLCLAGGVALNCQMNEQLRQRFRPQKIFAQPAANDAGTAMGAALEAWAHLTDGPFGVMEHAYLGPAYDDDAIEKELRSSGLSYRRSDDIAQEVAERIAGGEVFCWFSHRMEFGPRALGARSIVADPRSVAIKDRVNRIKDRQNWRPFGPSVLAGHQDDWFEDAFDTRFMLFTQIVRESMRARVPAVVHADGSTRPQIVHEQTHPSYHRMLSHFHSLTGVPMVLNTSFNRQGEPIVCTPRDALDSFCGLGADGLAIGNFIVSKPPKADTGQPLS
jgi:predicted NodU family carbamoyl transferase